MGIDGLGKRAVACKHWRWMDGMAANELPGYRVVSNNCEGRAYLTDGHDSQSVEDCSPVLSDPATLGCLLALVEAAWGEHCELMTAGAHKHDIDFRWDCHVYGRLWHEAFGGQTRAECLVAALEAAP